MNVVWYLVHVKEQEGFVFCSRTALFLCLLDVRRKDFLLCGGRQDNQLKRRGCSCHDFAGGRYTESLQRLRIY